VLLVLKPLATEDARAAIVPSSVAVMIDTDDGETPPPAAAAAAAAARALPAAAVQRPWATMETPWQIAKHSFWYVLPSLPQTGLLLAVQPAAGQSGTARTTCIRMAAAHKMQARLRLVGIPAAGVIEKATDGLSTDV
jgi:hypothetical protein